MSEASYRGQQTSPVEEREGGAALILVLVFVLGVVALVAFLVPNAQQNYASEGRASRRRALEVLVQQALNDVIHESKENADYDAVANGAGAVGVAPKTAWTAGGNFSDYGAGNVVTVEGRGMGAYMAVVRTDPADLIGDTQIVNIVAAYPSFANPVETVGAQVRIRTSLQGLFGDRSALSFAGNLAGSSSTGGGNFGWQNNGDQTVTIKSVNSYDPDGLGPQGPVYAPAVNISDPDFYNGFMAEFVNDPNHGEGTAGDGLDMEGGDLNDFTTTTTTIPDTITQEPSTTQRVNEAFLRQWIEHWRDAGNQAPNNTISNGNNSWSGGGAGQLTFLTASQLKGGAEISGSGTLVIRGDVTMTQGAKLNWDGDVIVIPSGGSGSGKLIVKDAEVNVTGGLVLVPDPDDNKTVGIYTDHENAAVNVTGTLLAIQAGTGSAVLSINKGGELNVNGLLGMLGDNISFEVNGAPGSLPGDPGRSKVNVSGSAVIAVPPGGSGLQKLRFDGASDTVFEFDNAKFESGVQTAEEGSEHSTVEPPPYNVYQTGYREVPAAVILAQFEALRLDPNDAAGLTAPE